MYAVPDNFRSLKGKLLFPLLMVGIIVAVVVTFSMYQLFQKRLADSLHSRGELVANMVSYAAETLSHSGELQRYVSAVGAEEGILQILVARGDTRQIIASTELVWLNKPLSDLPEDEVAEDLKKTLETRVSHSHFNAREHLFDFSAPLILSQSASGGELIEGAVMVHLDTRSFEVDILNSTLLFSGIFVVGLLVLAILGYFLISRLVLRRLVAIGDLVEMGEINDSSAWGRVIVRDEIGGLALRLKNSMQNVDRAMRELERQKDAYHESENRYRMITGNSSDIIFRISEKGEFNYVSPASAVILGLESELMLGKSFFDLIHPQERERARLVVSNVANVDVIDMLSCQISSFNGGYIWAEISLRGLQEKNDGYAGEVIGVLRDVTERQRIENMKNEFVSTVSHELRTPLTSISGALGLIAGGAFGDIPDQPKQLVEVAYRNSQRLTLLINDLLDMEKLVAGKIKLDMRLELLMPIVEQALDSGRTYGVERRVQLVVVRSVSNARVKVDSQRLMQVLSNLLSNAIKYSPCDDTVEISVDLRGESVRISIADHGPGIPDDFRDHIFGKFSQADSSDTRQKGGTGLGLAITKELVERMDGEIGFDSIEGQGACFYFDLPLFERDK